MANEFKVRKGLVVNGSGSVILDVQGSQGQLFSVTDQLSGSLFSVNDISGVPVLEAFSDSTVKIGQYLSEAIVVSGSTARITGSIAMAGFSSGSVLFAGPGGSISQNNASFFWDNTNSVLGLGTNTPFTTTGGARGLVINSGANNDCQIRVQSNATGTTSLDGFLFSLNSQLNAFLWNYENASLIFGTNNAERFRVFSTGNVGIATTSDSGERLQVSGSSRFAGNMVITGSGATSATNALTILNSASTNLLRVQNNGIVSIGNGPTDSLTTSGQAILKLNSTNNYWTIQNRDTSGLEFYIASYFGGTPVFVLGDGRYTDSVTINGLFQRAFAPVGSTGTYTNVELRGTINQTGGANGITRGLYVNPTLTAAADFRAIEWSNNISGSTSWGLYGAGTANNFLNGSLLIGTTSAAAKLTVWNGDIYLKSDRYIGAGNTEASYDSVWNRIQLYNGSTGDMSITMHSTGWWLRHNANASIAGNLVIGATTNTGERLQVSGSSRFNGNVLISGSGATGGTNAFIVQNSAGSQALAITNGLTTIVNGDLQLENTVLYWNAGTQLRNISNGVLRFTNSSANDFTRLQFGGGTTSYPALQRTGSAICVTDATGTFSSSLLVGTTTDTGERLQVSGSAKITNGLSVTGSIIANDITVTGTLTAQTIVAQTVTSSILYSSGSNIFGNSLSNTQDFTGSVRITGSLVIGSNSINSAFKLGVAGDVVVSGTAPYITFNNSTTSGSTPGYIQYTISSNLLDIYSSGTVSIVSNNSGATRITGGNTLIGTTVNDGVNRLQVSGSSRFVGNMTITGSANITQALTASAALISGSGTQRLTVVGSGSAQPLFTVQGSQGELFSIVDSLSGSLFSVNDQSGLPIMEVFSDNTILMGNYLDPMLLTTARTSSAAGINTLYTLPTSSYDAVYIDYTIRSGSNARAGNFMAMWSGTSVNFTDNSITEFGTTSGFVFGAHISGSNMIVTGSSSTSGWTVKTIIKAI